MFSESSSPNIDRIVKTQSEAIRKANRKAQVDPENLS